MLTVTLSNGYTLPHIGFGPGIMAKYPAKNLLQRMRNRILRTSRENAFSHAITTALQSGFRLIDFSAAYGDGGAIAQAIQASGIPAEEFFLTGRISNRAQRQGPKGVRAEFQRILDGYQRDFVDLLMFHWPVTGHYEATWEVLRDLYEQGKAKSIGVANCHVHHLEALMRVGMCPMINQIEVHPLFTQNPLRSYCKEHNIIVESYTPIARFDDRLMGLPALRRIAEAHDKTRVQVVLRWHIQHGMIPVIRSLNKKRQQENFGIFDFSLSEEEMKIIDGFNINSRLRYDPDNCDFSIL